MQGARLFRLGSRQLPGEEVADDAGVPVPAAAMVERHDHARALQGLEHLPRVGSREERVTRIRRQLRQDRVVLIMTFRSDELHRRHPLLPWLAELDRSGIVDRVDLGRLDATATHALLAAILDAPPSAELVAQIHRRSDGNPFFVEELLGGHGAGRPPAADPARGPLRPDRRVAECAQTVIGVAAVAGGRVDHDILAHVAGLADEDLLDGLRDAVGSHVLVTGPPAPEVITVPPRAAQEAAYDDLLPGARQRLHRAFAEALTAVPGSRAAGHWGELAYHWAAARDEPCGRRSGEAAAAGIRRCPPARRALEWTMVEGPRALAGIDRVELLGRAAGSLAGGRFTAGVALRRRGPQPRADADRPRRALAAWGALWVNTETEAALEAHERAMTIMPTDPPTPELARVLSGYGQIMMLLDRWTESLELCSEPSPSPVRSGRAGSRPRPEHARTRPVRRRTLRGSLPASDAALASRAGSPTPTTSAGATSTARSRSGSVATSVARRGDPARYRSTDEVGVTRTYGGFRRANGSSTRTSSVTGQRRTISPRRASPS
jgi:hypothetical protein